LSLLEQSSAHSTAELARALDVSPALVEQMLDHLVRLGRLQVVDGCEAGACRGCPSAQTCTPTRPVKLWRLVPDPHGKP